MTVKELIEHLSKLNPEAIVLKEDNEGYLFTDYYGSPSPVIILNKKDTEYYYYIDMYVSKSDYHDGVVL